MSELLEPLADGYVEPDTVAPPDPQNQAPPSLTQSPEESASAPAPEELKYVPLAALHESRSENKALKAELEALRGKGAEVESLRQQLHALAARIPAPTPEPEAPAAPLLADDQADALARNLQLFDATGAPDREAARRAAGIMAQMAEAQAAKAVAPMMELSAAERAAQYRQRAEAVQDADGRRVDPELLGKMFQVVPPALIAANPQIPAILTYAAAGYERIHGKRPPAAPETPPVVSERAGGRPEKVPTLGDLELGFLERTGRKADDYVKSLKHYRPGMPMILE